MRKLKSLKIPKRKSEYVNRRTENTMAKRKKDKRTNNDLQNIHIKLKIEPAPSNGVITAYLFVIRISFKEAG
jgi:hypothetical protein